MLTPSVFEKFVNKWRDDEDSRPLIVLIGGYAGTGKSTFAKKVSAATNDTQILPTGIIRSIVQLQALNASNPVMFSQSYDMHMLVETKVIKNIFDGFSQQSKEVLLAINSIIDFMAREKQNIIIEGNHILPAHFYDQKYCEIVEIYFGVRDEKLHRNMLGGETHKRLISDLQFETARNLHDHIVNQAIKENKIIFWENEHTAAMEYIAKQLQLKYRL